MLQHHGNSRYSRSQSGGWLPSGDFRWTGSSGPAAVEHALEDEAVRGGRLAGSRAIPRREDRADVLGGDPAPAGLDERADDRADHLMQERVGASRDDELVAEPAHRQSLQVSDR